MSDAPHLVRGAAAEALGTFLMVLIGCGSVVAFEHTAAPTWLVVPAVGLAFGGTITLVIRTLGPTSGAHLNPAVSLAMWRAGRMPGRHVMPWIAAQVVGAVLAAAALTPFATADSTLGSTVPSIHLALAAALELALAFALVFVILWVTRRPDARLWVIAVVVGGTVAIEATLFGPFTGASMNPARSLGPALVSGTFTHLWLYLVMTVAGGLLAVPTCRACDRGQASENDESDSTPCCSTPTHPATISAA